MEAEAKWPDIEPNMEGLQVNQGTNGSTTVDIGQEGAFDSDFSEQSFHIIFIFILKTIL